MIRKSLSISMMLAAATLVTAVQAHAADIKIGVVDMQTLLQKSPQGQAASQEMSKKFDNRKKDLMAQQDKIKNLQDQLSKNGAVMSANQLQDTQSQLDELQRDFGRKQSDYVDDVNTERNSVLSRLQQEVIKAVQEFAQAQKYNLVIPGDSIFYKDNTVDVTDQVLVQMQKDFKTENAASGN